VYLNPPVFNANGRDLMEQEEINHLKCHNVSALLPMEGDTNIAGAISATSGINSSNLLHKVIKYFYYLGPIL